MNIILSEFHYQGILSFSQITDTSFEFDDLQRGNHKYHITQQRTTKVSLPVLTLILMQE